MKPAGSQDRRPGSSAGPERDRGDPRRPTVDRSANLGGGQGHPRRARVCGAHDHGTLAGLLVNRALVSYYFGSKAGLLAALVESLFPNPDVGYAEEIRASRDGEDRADAILDWQR